MPKLEQRIGEALERSRKKLQKAVVLDVLTITLNGRKAYILPVKIGAAPETMEAALVKEFEKDRWQARTVDGYVALPSPPPRTYQLMAFNILPEKTLTTRHGNQYTSVGLRGMLSDILLKAEQPLSSYQLRQMLEEQGMDEKIKNLKGRVSATLSLYPEFVSIGPAQYVHAKRKKEFA